MSQIDPEAARDLLDAAVASLSLLGGTMAYLSGFWAYQALSQEQPPHAVAEAVNKGIGQGFAWGAPAAVAALIISLWI